MTSNPEDRPWQFVQQAIWFCIGLLLGMSIGAGHLVMMLGERLGLVHDRWRTGD